MKQERLLNVIAWVCIVCGILGAACAVVSQKWTFASALWPINASIWAYCCLLYRRLSRLQSHHSFVQGAKWWEYQKTGATMWQSDQSEAYKHAQFLAEQGKLGRRD